MGAGGGKAKAGCGRAGIGSRVWGEQTKGPVAAHRDWPLGLLWLPETRYPALYAENELPQPQPPVALGFLKVKPDPCMDVT
jgi:hypothetical protein